MKQTWSNLSNTDGDGNFFYATEDKEKLALSEMAIRDNNRDQELTEHGEEIILKVGFADQVFTVIGKKRREEKHV